MLTTFWMILGYGCNNHCLGCYALSMNNSSGPMPLTYAKDVLSVMGRHGVRNCLILGGEPTLYPDLPRIISCAKDNGVRTTLITNGRRLNSIAYLEKLLTAGLKRLVISVEGSNEVIHNKVTGEESFAETMAGIKNAVHLGVRVITLTTIGLTNHMDCLELPKVLSDLGVRDISFNCGIPTMDKGGADPSESLAPDQIAEIIIRVHERYTNKAIKLCFNLTIPACLIPENELKVMLADKTVQVGCQMYRGLGAAFDPKGSILPCTHLPDFPLLTNCQDGKGHFKLGDEFFKVWEDESQGPADFRRRLWRYPAKKCRGCKYWGACIGGCPVFWAHYDPRNFIH
jgi:radical SAM protein with 4Fe4S-binding SPASM domain